MSDQPMVNLNVSDISDAVKVIDFACEQGAYRGWEVIRQVQAVRDRLDAFVAAAAKITAAAETETTEGEDGNPELVAEDTPVAEIAPRRQRRQRIAR